MPTRLAGGLGEGTSWACLPSWLVGWGGAFATCAYPVGWRAGGGTGWVRLLNTAQAQAAVRQRLQGPTKFSAHPGRERSSPLQATGALLFSCPEVMCLSPHLVRCTPRRAPPAPPPSGSLHICQHPVTSSGCHICIHRFSSVAGDTGAHSSERRPSMAVDGIKTPQPCGETEYGSGQHQNTAAVR